MNSISAEQLICASTGNLSVPSNPQISHDFSPTKAVKQFMDYFRSAGSSESSGQHEQSFCRNVSGVTASDTQIQRPYQNQQSRPPRSHSIAESLHTSRVFETFVNEATLTRTSVDGSTESITFKKTFLAPSVSRVELTRDYLEDLIAQRRGPQLHPTEFTREVIEELVASPVPPTEQTGILPYPDISHPLQHPVIAFERLPQLPHIVDMSEPATPQAVYPSPVNYPGSENGRTFSIVPEDSDVEMCMESLSYGDLKAIQSDFASSTYGERTSATMIAVEYSGGRHLDNEDAQSIAHSEVSNAASFTSSIDQLIRPLRIVPAPIRENFDKRKTFYLFCCCVVIPFLIPALAAPLLFHNPPNTTISPNGSGTTTHGGSTTSSYKSPTTPQGTTNSSLTTHNGTVSPSWIPPTFLPPDIHEGGFNIILIVQQPKPENVPPILCDSLNDTIHTFKWPNCTECGENNNVHFSFYSFGGSPVQYDYTMGQERFSENVKSWCESIKSNATVNDDPFDLAMIEPALEKGRRSYVILVAMRSMSTTSNEVLNHVDEAFVLLGGNDFLKHIELFNELVSFTKMTNKRRKSPPMVLSQLQRLVLPSLY